MFVIRLSPSDAKQSSFAHHVLLFFCSNNSILIEVLFKTKPKTTFASIVIENYSSFFRFNCDVTLLWVPSLDKGREYFSQLSFSCYEENIFVPPETQGLW